MIAGYRRFCSPWLAALGVRCRFEPSCSAYAMDAFASRAWPHAGLLTLWRLCRCAPWTQGGLDPLDPQRERT
jgi:hypothetical protein